MKALLNYFFRGMLFVFPVGATIYLVLITIDWVNVTFNNLLFGWIDYDIPGLGIVTTFAVIAFTGFVFTRAFTRPVITIIEGIISRTPIVSIIYSSLKDLTEAFVGEKKKFNKPVKVQFGEMGLTRFGFITQKSLGNLGLDNEIAVYCPHSYNFSGNLYIVPKDSVTPLEVDPANFMRFIVSGGVTNI
jgi:uncharacterized membrane protein